MENSIIIYKILKAISAAMDNEEFDEDVISPEALKTTQLRRDRIAILCELTKAGSKNITVNMVRKNVILHIPKSMFNVSEQSRLSMDK